MKQGIDTRGPGYPNELSPYVLEQIKLREQRNALGWWDPDLEEREEWQYIASQRAFKESIDDPDYLFFPDSPHF